MTQSMINEGKITVREVDFTGKGSENSPVAGEGGILKLVRDLMSPTLFTTLPLPTPDYRALPDSATRALETGGGTKAFLTNGDAAARRHEAAGQRRHRSQDPRDAYRRRADAWRAGGPVGDC